MTTYDQSQFFYDELETHRGQSLEPLASVRGPKCSVFVVSFGKESVSKSTHVEEVLAPNTGFYLCFRVFVVVS